MVRMNIICKVFGHEHCDVIAIKIESAMLFSIYIGEVYMSRCKRCNRWIVPSAIYQVISESKGLQKTKEFHDLVNATPIPTEEEVRLAIEKLI